MPDIEVITPDTPAKVKTETFSETVPGHQRAWDSTSLGELKTCPRRYYYRVILGYVPRGQSAHLTFGLLYHSALETYDHVKAKGESHDEAVRQVVFRILEQTWDPVLGRPWASDNNLKTRDSLLRTVIWYLEKFAEDPISTVILRNNKPAVELSFRFEPGLKSSIDGKSYILCGHLDRLVTFQDSYWNVDRKTTKYQLDENYGNKFTPDNQMSMYSVAGQLVLDAPIQGIIIDAAQVGVNFSRFQRYLVHRHPTTLTEWLDDTSYWLKIAEGFAQANYWPMNDKACVSGDTEVSIERGSRKGWKVSVKKLYELFHGINMGPRGQKNLITQVLCDKNGIVGYNRLLDIVINGRKTVYEITTTDGTITATGDHEFRTTLGWKRVEDFDIGEELYFWGSRKGLKSKKTPEQRTVVYGVKYHPLCWGREYYQYTQRRARLVYEANMNQLSYKEFVQVLKTDEKRSKTFAFLAAEAEVHHKDGDPLNDAFGNLEPLTVLDHKDKHTMEAVNRLDISELISVKEIGEELVYDLCMEAPYHNFIANGFVAHNCLMYYSASDPVYSGCPYRSVCSVAPMMRKAHLEANFNKSVWDPLVIRGDL